MALKITTEIGTNRGITSEAYIRLKNYDLQKSGRLSLGIQVYQNESDANQPIGQTPLYKEAISLEIGSVLNVPLLKEETIIVMKDVETEEVIQVPDMSIIEGQDIFAFGYSKLKDKLVSLYGADNVIDC